MGGVPPRAVGTVLTVLFVEYLILALPRAILPRYQAAAFGDKVITVAAVTESIKGLFALVSNLTLGQLSDAWGRKRLLLVTATGTVLPSAVLAFTTNMWAYQVVLALSGLFAATWSVTLATITDLEADSQLRMRWFGLAMSCLALSLIVGPPVGAASCETQAGCTGLFVSLPVLAAANAALIAVGVPATSPPLPEPLPGPLLPRRRSSDSGSEGPTSPRSGRHSEEGIRSAGLGTIGLLRSNRELRLLATVTACYFVPVYGVISTLLVFLTQEHRFRATDGAALLSLMGGTAVMACTFGVPVAQAHGVSAKGTVKCGLCSLGVALAIFGFGRQRHHFLAGGVALGGAFVTMPGVSSLVSAVAPAAEQGAAQGGVNGVKALCEGLGPLVFAALFAAAPPSLPALPFVLSVGTVIAALWQVDGVTPPPDAAVRLPTRRSTDAPRRATDIRSSAASIVMPFDIDF